MTELTRLDLVNIGLHASNTDFTTVPGTLHSVDAKWHPSNDLERLRSESMRGDGKMRASRTGKKTASLPSLVVPLRGCKSSGAGDGVSSGAGVNNLVVDAILQSVFGQAPVASVGETSDGADAGSGTTVNADAASSFATGQGLLVKGTTSGRWNARQVESKASAAITVDRALLDDGSADTADEATVLYGMDTYGIAWDEPKHKHLTLKHSKEGGRVDTYVGCLGTLELDFPAGADAKLSLNGLGFTDHNITETAAAYSAPLEGEEVLVLDSPFFIGSEEYLATSVKTSITPKIVPRGADGSRNGNVGFIVDGIEVKVVAKILVGSMSRHIAESLIDTIRGATQDVAAQHGSTPGAISYQRIPAADTVSAVLGEENGQRILTWTFEAARSTKTNDYSISLG